MRISNRIKSMQFSPIRKLASYASDAEKNGIKVYHLNIGQPDIKTPECFFDGLKLFDDKVIKYSDSKGNEDLRKSFESYYEKWGIDIKADDILITNGGSEALLFAIISICDPGDEIIIPEPFYTNYNGFCDVASVKVVPFLTKAEDGFHLPNKEIIESKITDKTRAIIISNPGNPTGVVYTEKEIRMLSDIALENDLYLISDEVYREFVYDNLKYTSVLYMTDILDRVILIDSISKRYSACGARIGIVASKNKDLMHQILKVCQSRLCVSIIEQSAAANLINTPEEYFIAVKEEYEKRRDILYDSLIEIPGIICRRPTGAFYIVVKLPIENSEDFAKWLLQHFSIDKKTVMIAPAAGFYATDGLGMDEIRLSYCLNCDALKEAMNIFSKGLQEYINKK